MGRIWLEVTKGREVCGARSIGWLVWCIGEGARVGLR